MKAKTVKINKYNDPSHGWYRVPIKLIEELGIENQISFFSYRLKRYAYIEEDSDAQKLFEALEKHNIGAFIENFWTNKPSKIRTYPRFN